MKVKLEYGNRIIYLSPYYSKVERDILLYTSLNDDIDIDDIIDIVKDCIEFDISLLSHSEKIVVLYKLRSVSIGEEVPVRFVCSECNAVNEQNVNISDLTTSQESTNANIIDAYKEITEDSFQDFINIEVDELEIEEYDKLYEETKQSVTLFNLNQTKNCHKCKNKIDIDISNTRFVSENLSEDTLMSLYTSTSDLIFFSHYTRTDIENMIPFERSIFVSLLNKTREDLAK